MCRRARNRGNARPSLKGVPRRIHRFLREYRPSGTFWDQSARLQGGEPCGKPRAPFSASPIRSAIHLAILVVGALVAAVIVWRAPGAGADSSVSQSGQVGNHFLFDEPTDPGARCLYSPGTGVFSITVDGPYVLGLDRSPGTEQTEVSWRAIAVRNGVQVQTSASILGTAFEEQSAGFTTPIQLTLLDSSGVYTAQVEITWFESTPSGPPVVLGTSLRRVDVYAQNLEGTGGPDTIVNSCQAISPPTAEPTATTTPLPTSTSSRPQRSRPRPRSPLRRPSPLLPPWPLPPRQPPRGRQVPR